ncbi:hypothetical protein [Rhizobium sp. BE258]|uniref:hypothetical protein n=1 Tax=Rhizobium sp. BE258 TaxID=2817722 RepID=UPI002863DF2A|nr:hypothetical protein [Rhizobium sp. BE258]MDR7145553.1 hypothetical protein [Rhizobium sp. BE258]
MTDLFELRFFDGEPHILDIDLARALNMRIPIDIRTKWIVMFRANLLSVGYLYRDGKATYLNEAQARTICYFSSSRRAAQADAAVIETFRRFRLETLPQMDVVEVLTMGIKQFDQITRAGDNRLVIDVLRLKLLATSRVRERRSRRQRERFSQKHRRWC